MNECNSGLSEIGLPLTLDRSAAGNHPHLNIFIMNLLAVSLVMCLMMSLTSVKAEPVGEEPEIEFSFGDVLNDGEAPKIENIEDLLIRGAQAPEK
ncbi:Hypothetical predicted protein [Xyrichtys novacula]|uniref:Uncharacterized protein n=1 Tax=Xyrichtys novacula TaxID=13765 RepID=A0AAV1G9W0_XYRNO|nr:Hypothetical predicted protein [Xyrichtys novacula]